MPIQFDSLFERLIQVLPSGLPVYAVGGAVRDRLLGRPTHDLDLVLPRGAAEIGRQVANALGAAYFPLDLERETVRVVLEGESEPRQYLDFSIFRGADITEDLRGRDFTINALAVDIHQPDQLIDPLGGLADLRARRLQLCAPDAFEQDPLRVLRAVRLAANYELHIPPEVRHSLRQARGGLERISPERIRDELFKMLSGRQPATAIRVLDAFGLLPVVLPELEALRGVQQSPPHTLDVLNHTYMVVQKLGELVQIMDHDYQPDLAANLTSGTVTLHLGRYRRQISAHLQVGETIDRSALSLLYFAALYHDAGKSQTYHQDEDGRIRFFEHEKISAKLVGERAHRLRLSNLEIERVKNITRNHMRPLWLAQDKGLPSRKAIYRFFRDTGHAGVDICLHSLADVWATVPVGLDQQAWERQVLVVRSLLEAWWEQPETSVAPPALLSGRDLILHLDLSPGAMIGRILEAVREEQASGMVTNREQALRYAAELLGEWSDENPLEAD